MDRIRKTMVAIMAKLAVMVASPVLAAEPQAAFVAGKPDLLIGAYAPADVGYTAREYFLSGDATSYAAEDEKLPRDGRWQARRLESAAYTTRIVAMVPEKSRFNGTVIVEWLNVSGGVDSPAVWLMAHRHMTRSGYAYVAVSAQKVGVEGGASVMGPDHSLKKTNPARYAELHHPGDGFSYDIFSQVGRLVKKDTASDILGGLIPQRVIAVGESQSATFLATYINAVDPLAKIYDGFLVHSRLGTVSRLSGDMDLGARESRVAGVQLRPDLRVPTLTFITEGDLVGFPGVIGYYSARQPDTELLRVWELAGASHADNYTIVVAPIDTGSEPIEKLAAAYAPTSSILGLPVERPINFGPQHHYVVQAALSGLEAWVRTGTRPSSSPRIDLTNAEPPALVLDGNGMATGGIRTPWVDVPTARLSSDGNPGNLMAAIFGTAEPFDKATIKRLYPGGRRQYLQLFSASLDRTIRQGFILQADRAEILALAARMFPDD